MAALRDQPINTSFLSPIGFKFQLNNFPEVNYFCQAATLPGISISAIDVPTPQKAIAIAGDEVQFEELSIRFIVDENMKNWFQDTLRTRNQSIWKQCWHRSLDCQR